MEKVTEHAEYHHMPDHENERPDLHGLTLRQALKTLRALDFGNLGGMHSTQLSDNSMLEVVNAPAQGGGSLMNSQRARRYIHTNNGTKTIRYYKIR